MLNVIIEENLYDKEFVDKWTFGFDKLSELVKQYPPEKTEEITWVPADTIYELARVYATNKPAVIFEGNGIDQQPTVVQTVRALSILRAITGNLDVPGGNVFPPETPPFMRTPDMTMRKRTTEDMEKAFQESISKHPLYFRFMYCSVPELVDTILTDEPYPIKATIVSGINPLVITSNTIRVKEALKKIDFLVVLDTFMSATAELADVVLPAATFLEKTMLVKLQRPTLDATYYQLAPKALEPLGESKSEYEFASELAKQMGHEEAFPWKSVEEAIDYELKPVGLSYKQLEEHAEPVIERKYPPDELYRKYERFFAALPAKKVELYSNVFANLGYDPLPAYKEHAEGSNNRPDLAMEFPLICMASLKPGLYTHSQFHSLPWLKEIMPDPWIEIHSRKAEELGIKDGEMVTVVSPRDSIQLRCKVVKTTDPRVVMITHGWGNPYVGIQPTANILTPSEIRCPISNATSNRCFMVKVTRST